jgi:radical SAM protein with 4Fe4S-binding SPASM domain
MQALNYATFSARVAVRGAGDRIPLSGAIEVSRRCPLHCVQCYNNLPMGDAAARRAELSTTEHYRILDEIAEAGCLWLLYTGGEIFARPDFLDIYIHAKRQGLLITMFTNGTLISPRIADHLARYRPFSVEITLYGATASTYERVTGVPGSYEQCWHGIRLLVERGLPLKLKTVGLTINRHELWQMQRQAEEAGLEFAFDAQINPRIDCSLGPLGFRLDPAAVVALDLQDPRRLAEWRRLAERFGASGGWPATGGSLYDCGAGISSFAIDPEGMLTLCVLSHRDRFDLRRGTFREGWDGFLRAVRAQKVARPTACAACSLRWMCAMCPANGHLENRDAERPVAFLCETSHLRAYALGMPVLPHGDCPYCEGGTRFGALAAAAVTISEMAAASRSS